MVLSLEESGELSDNTLDDMKKLSSTAFEEKVIDYHKKLFLGTKLEKRRSFKKEDSVESAMSTTIPAGETCIEEIEPIGKFEATYDANGALVTHEAEDGSIQEGWVYATPYWDPESTIKVCAFEAQKQLYRLPLASLVIHRKDTAKRTVDADPIFNGVLTIAADQTLPILLPQKLKSVFARCFRRICPTINFWCNPLPRSTGPW